MLYFLSGKYTKTTVYVKFTVSEGTDIVVKDSSDNVISLQDGYYKKAITENGTYTIYVRDSVGNEVIDTIEITDIE